MSDVEANLDNDGGLSEEAYLDALVQQAPPAVSLLNDVGCLQIVKGFLIFAALMKPTATAMKWRECSSRTWCIGRLP
jgi:hypothetical protein